MSTRGWREANLKRTHLDPRLPVHWPDAHRHAAKRLEIISFLADVCRHVRAWREMLTGNGLAYMDDKDEEQFGRALRLRASQVDKQNRRVSSLCAQW
jgi:hypothetical protein